MVSLSNMEGVMSFSKKFFVALAVACLTFICVNQVMAAEFGTADEAIAMVKKATAYMNANGREKTIADINRADPQFKDRDLYIFVTDMNGKQLANAATPRLIGKDILELKDSNGKYFVKELIELAKTKGSGWVDYRWPNPAKNTIESKSTYVQKVGDVLIACGIYK